MSDQWSLSYQRTILSGIKDNSKTKVQTETALQGIITWYVMSTPICSRIIISFSDDFRLKINMGDACRI